MSLLDALDPALQPALDRVRAELSAPTASREDRAMLQNLEEEDRVPEAAVTKLHAALAATPGRDPAASAVGKACAAAERALELDARDRPAAHETWYNHLQYEGLLKDADTSDASFDLPGPPHVSSTFGFDRTSWLMAPKNLAIAAPEKTALWLAIPLRLYANFFRIVNAFNGCHCTSWALPPCCNFKDSD